MKDMREEHMHKIFVQGLCSVIVTSKVIVPSRSKFFSQKHDLVLWIFQTPVRDSGIKIVGLSLSWLLV